MIDKSILIIDDSTIIRERLVNRLEQLPGVRLIEQAKDKVSALAVLQRMHPEIAIIDIQLPDGNGIDILGKIKKENCSTVVIVLTNYPYSVIRKRCLELGADYFFDKSTEFEKIFDVLDKISIGASA
ncbi:MAG: response regulator transcription factor [Bacteroidota bacterium]|nr:response regulator transcription factor [Bacteroidota bacterium]